MSPRYNPKTGKPKNRVAAKLGKLGGAKGGRARAANLTPEQRSEAARRAILARWSSPEAVARRLAKHIETCKDCRAYQPCAERDRLKAAAEGV